MSPETQSIYFERDISENLTICVKYTSTQDWMHEASELRTWNQFRRTVSRRAWVTHLFHSCWIQMQGSPAPRVRKRMLNERWHDWLTLILSGSDVKITSSHSNRRLTVCPNNGAISACTWPISRHEYVCKLKGTVELTGIATVELLVLQFLDDVKISRQFSIRGWC